MSAKALFPLALALASCAPTTAPAPVATADQSGKALAESCEGRDGWSDAAPPARIYGNTYYVGTCGISVILITSDKGHVLIDGATEKAAPSILANIQTLGFHPKDVKFILTSHEHDDHVGGVAAIKAVTGATLVARAEAVPALESGKVGPNDPQYEIANPFAGAKVDRVIKDGEVLRLGPIAITAIATPGHTMGGTSWRWESCDGGKCQSILFADSITAVSADNYRFSDHPALVAIFRATFERVAGFSCDFLLTPHPGASVVFERLSGAESLVSAGQCAAYAESGRKRLDGRLEKEKTAKP